MPESLILTVVGLEPGDYVYNVLVRAAYAEGKRCVFHVAARRDLIHEADLANAQVTVTWHQQCRSSEWRRDMKPNTRELSWFRPARTAAIKLARNTYRKYAEEGLLGLLRWEYALTRAMDNEVETEVRVALTRESREVDHQRILDVVRCGGAAMEKSAQAREQARVRYQNACRLLMQELLPDWSNEARMEARVHYTEKAPA